MSLKAEAAYSVIDVDTIRQHHVHIMQLIHLPTLVPVLQRHQLLPKEDLARISDAQHHGTIERTGFLLHSLYKKDQVAVDNFVRCLREAKSHQGHRDILTLLEKGLPDKPDRPPIFEVLDARMSEIVGKINITLFLNHLANSGAIKVTAFLDLVNPDRSVQENLQRLLRVLEEKGTQGFIDFLVCLRKEHTEPHEELFRILFQDIQTFFKEHPRRDTISASDKIEILQLETKGKVLEQEVLRRFKEHRQKLTDELSLVELLPQLRKHDVVSEEEAETMNLEGLEQREQNQALLSVIESKPAFWVVKFSECLRESSKYRHLSELLLPASDVTSKEKQDPIMHKKDKVVVMVQMSNYVEVDKDYQLKKVPPQPTRDFKKECDTLRGYFTQLEFEVIDLVLTTVNSSRGAEEDSKEHKLLVQSHERRLVEKFWKEVASKCAEEAIVFIYINGIQFPFEDLGATADMPGKRFSGAILLSEASTVSRKEIDCLKARDLLSWLQLLPHAYITLLIDTEQDFVAKFGKHRDPQVVDIIEDPWSMLTGLNSSAVVYYLQPDARTMAQVRNKNVRQATGMLTEGFNFALLHCFLRRGRGERDDVRLCHRRFYEGMSFYWHRRGRQHKVFVPAVRGDMSREFLGKKLLPYNQVFRVDLVRSAKEKDEMFDMDKLYVQTGTMAGISYGDKVELTHVLHPGLLVRGSVSHSTPLNSVVAIEDRDSQIKLSRALRDIYQDEELQTKDGSTEFLNACKILPLHEKLPVATEGLRNGESATIKSYVESSPQLCWATRASKPKIVVRRSGDMYYAEDKEGDVTVKVVKVKRLALLPTFLEMIAWYKYVKNKLKSGRKPPLTQYNCFLTAEKPLLHAAVPLCEEFNIKWSSFENAPPSSKGHEVILQATEPQTFWTPSPPARDPQPCLEVAFKDNHIVTAIELKGDFIEEKYVKKADVYHQRDMCNQVVTYSSEDVITKMVKFSDEQVQFVTLTPLELPSGNNFTISFKMTCRILSGSETVSKVVEDLTVINWGFHEHISTGWKFVPTPDQSGRITCHAGSYNWVTWSGKSRDPVTLDLGISGVKLEKMEFTSTSETNYLKRFLLRVQTSWKKEELPEITSPWPRKHEFPRPLVLSNIQLWPAAAKQVTGTMQLSSDVRVQLQLFGNKYERPMEVEEGEILSFHFTNFTLKPHFVYILCLEETGNIKHVMMDVAEPVYQEGSVTKYPVMKKLIQTYIPEGYGPELNQIRDTYKVFISQQKLYLEPFVQRSLKNCHHPCSYTVCRVGHKPEPRSEDWYGVTFEVVVKKSTSRM